MCYDFRLNVWRNSKSKETRNFLFLLLFRLKDSRFLKRLIYHLLLIRTLPFVYKMIFNFSLNFRDKKYYKFLFLLIPYIID